MNNSTNQFGGNDKYYSDSHTDRQRSNQDSSKEHNIVHTLLQKVDYQIRDRVQRTYRQWNTVIRNHIRDETRLKLSDGEAYQAIPVKIVDGLPKPFSDYIGEIDEKLLWLLVNMLTLETTGKGLDILKESSDYINNHLLKEPVADIRASLEKSSNFCHQVFRELMNRQELGKIKEINEDILGAYFFNIPEIQIYWMVIGIVATMLGVSIESLTIVVLIHEIAHAYHHRGLDIDGYSWETLSFEKADIHIVEGLAQFYTENIANNISERYPEIRTAYERLLELQSPPYVDYRGWSDKEKKAGEIIRAAMIETRINDIRSYQDFKNRIQEYKTQIGNHRTPKNKRQILFE
jgi:hypothetical protein